MIERASAAQTDDTAFFGHPRGLSTLFFTELWERFSYYGMRAILILFMTAPLAAGGMEYDVGKAGAVYGTYVSLVYLLALPGGWVADRLIGMRRAVLYGGIIIMLGHISLAVPGESSFYLGLLLIVVGTGLLKPNVSAMVGTLYEQGDVRRDSGFSIYYMGINVGAFISPFVVGGLAQLPAFQRFLESVGLSAESSWHFGFAMAALGMFVGLVWYVKGGKYLGDRGMHPAPAESPEAARRLKRNTTIGVGGIVGALLLLVTLATMGVVTITPEGVAQVVGVSLLLIIIGFFTWLFMASQWTREERKRLYIILVLFVAAAVFWSAFEQAGSSLNLFAQNDTRSYFPASWFQSANALFIILLTPLFAWLWVWLAQRRRDPSAPAKFSFGLILVGAGFLVMMVAASLSAAGVKVSPMWLILTYFLHTVGELTLSPVGLSAMTKLAPQRIAGMVMGVWFMATSAGNFIAGTVVGLYASFTQSQVFGAVAAFSIGAGVILALLVRPMRRLMQSPQSTDT
ncbi:MAG: peptide MFS transporter [Gemmatimonadales bacterium]